MIDGISSSYGQMPIDLLANMSGANAHAKLSSSGKSIDETAQNFEAMFATQLLQPMFETVGVNSAFGGGNGEAVMRSFIVQEYGKLIAKSGKLGIAEQVKAVMIKAQEGSLASNTSQTNSVSANEAYVDTYNRR